MDFEELSNDEWSLLAPILCDQPRTGITRRGRPRIPPRVLANAMLWVLSIGGSWSKLPANYPSPPTCRSRFDEWRVDGKFDEMVRILSTAGRSFSYISGSSYPEKRSTPNANVSLIDQQGSPYVLWKSPASWLLSHGTAFHNSSESPDAITQTRAAVEVVSQSDTALSQPTSNDLAHQHCKGTPRAFWMGLASKGRSVVHAQGYVVYVAVDAVPDDMFRGWTEIIRDGRRVARSGLIGPKFCAPETAMQFALAWARSWIELNAGRARIQDAPGLLVHRLLAHIPP